MANVNLVLLVGRLTRDPEQHVFQDGGYVVKFGIAVNNPRKNQLTGEWEDDPMFIDVKAFAQKDKPSNAETILDTMRKGHQVHVEGKLVLEKWDDRSGVKRSKHVIKAVRVQQLERRTNQGSDGAATHGRDLKEYYEPPPGVAAKDGPVETQEEIPF